MKKIFQIISFILLSTSLIAQDKPVENEMETEPIPKEVKEVKKDEVKIEIIIDNSYYDDKKKKLKVSVSMYKKGPNKISHGPSISYYKNGNKKFEINYEHGKKHGLTTNFYKNGKKKILVTFKNGFQDGKQFYYNENKSLREVQYWELGKSKKIETFYPNGKINKRKVITGMKSGTLTTWYKNGNKKKHFTILNDNKHGLDSEWNKKAILQKESQWEDNKLNGIMKVYYNTGELKTVLEFKDNLAINERITTNKKGIVTAKCTYEKGEPFEGTVYNYKDFEIRTFKKGDLTATALCDNEGNLRKPPNK